MKIKVRSDSPKDTKDPLLPDDRVNNSHITFPTYPDISPRDPTGEGDQYTEDNDKILPRELEYDERNYVYNVELPYFYEGTDYTKSTKFTAKTVNDLFRKLLENTNYLKARLDTTDGFDIPIASDKKYGVVKLSDKITSFDKAELHGTAATPYAIHELYEYIKAVQDDQDHIVDTVDKTLQKVEELIKVLEIVIGLVSEILKANYVKADEENTFTEDNHFQRSLSIKRDLLVKGITTLQVLLVNEIARFYNNIVVESRDMDTGVYLRDPTIVKGEPPTKSVHRSMGFLGYEDNYSNRNLLGSVHYAYLGTKETSTSLRSYRANEPRQVDHADITIGYNELGLPYTSVPNPDPKSNDSSIASTKWVRDILDKEVLPKIRDGVRLISSVAVPGVVTLTDIIPFYPIFIVAVDRWDPSSNEVNVIYGGVNFNSHRYHDNIDDAEAETVFDSSTFIIPNDTLLIIDTTIPIKLYQ